MAIIGRAVTYYQLKKVIKIGSAVEVTCVSRTAITKQAQWAYKQAPQAPCQWHITAWGGDIEVAKQTNTLRAWWGSRKVSSAGQLRRAEGEWRPGGLVV